MSSVEAEKSIFSRDFLGPDRSRSAPIAVGNSNGIPMNDGARLELRTVQRRDWQLLLVAAGLSICAGSFAAPSAVNPQTKMHVELGESILQSGRLSRGTQIADGYCWINDCHLTQVIMAWIARIGGPPGLAAAGFAVGLASIAVMIIFSRRDEVTWPSVCAVALLAALLLLPGWQVGPQTASIACFTALMAVVQFAFTGWRGNRHWTSLGRMTRSGWRPETDPLRVNSRRLRALWLAGPIFCLWSNMDGTFRLGLIVFWVYVAVRGLEALCQRGNAGWGLIRRMLLMGAIASLSTLLNPYGPWLHGWLSNPNTLSARAALHGLPVPIADSPTWPLFALCLVLSATALTVSFRRLDLAQTAALVAAAAMVIVDAGNALLFAIPFGFWMAAQAMRLEAIVLSFLHQLFTRRARSFANRAGHRLK